MASSFEHVTVRLSSCPICGSTELQPREAPHVWIGEEVFGAHRGAFGVTACADCSFEFVNPRPTDELLGEFYGGVTYSCHDPSATDTSDARAAHLLDFMARHVDGRRMLDFGCGAGVMLRAAVARGWEPTGYDLGAAAVENCREQGLTATASLDELARGTYDAILLSHVFEHVTDREQTLASLYELLAPDGRLFIECPNVKSLRARLSHPALSRHARFDERYRAFPIHLSYFTPKTLTDLLRRCRFDVVESTTWGFGIEELVLPAPRSPLADRMSTPKLSGAPERPAHPLKKLAKSVLTKLILEPGLGENIVVVARAER